MGKSNQRGLSVVFLILFLAICVPTYGQEHLRILQNTNERNFHEIVRRVEAYYADKDKGKGSGYKQFKRWEYFYRTRLDENGNLINVSQQQLEEAAREKRRPSQARVASSGNWQAAGPVVTYPQNHNGRVNCIAVDPADPATIYAGSPSGGLWRSTDGGSSWNCITDAIPATIGITSVVIDPLSNPDNRTLYILTGDRPSNTIRSIGVWKSTDNGTTWQQTTAPAATHIYKLVMHPSNNRLLLYSGNGRIYKSSDAGATWISKLSGYFTDIEFHPANPDIVYIAGLTTGPYRSVDAGETWQSAGSAPMGDRIEIAVTPADPAIVFAIQAGSGTTGGLYKSINHGVSYTKVQSSFQLNSQSWYNLALAVSPTDPKTLYAADVLSYISVDGGITWTRNPLGHVDYHALEFHNGYLYVGNDGGVVRKNLTTGEVQNLSEGLPISQMYKLGHNPHDAETMLIGTQDNGVSSLHATLSDQVRSGDGMECFYDPLRSDMFFGSTQNGVLFRYDNDHPLGRNVNPPGTSGTGDWVTPFLHDPTDPYAIYAGFRDVWRNPSRGWFDWVNLTNGATGTVQARVLAVAPSDNNYIYVVKGGSYLYGTTNGGESWTKLNQNQTYTSITIHPDNPKVLWATGVGFGRSATSRVGKSTDGGLTWTDATGSLPDVSTNCSVYQKNSANGIYIGNDLGVYYKDDTMADWVLFQQGMPKAIVRDLEINEAAGKLYAGTYGRGAWVSDLYNAPAGADPVLTITSPADKQTFTAPASVNFTANASDSDGTIAKVEFYNGTAKLGEDVTSPYTFIWNNVSAGNYTLIAKAIDNSGASATDTVAIAVTNTTACAGTGKIQNEVWTGITGLNVSSIPVDSPPSSVSDLTAFETPSGIGDNYGSRVRGYLCVPATGNYTFWISSDDRSELWLSTDEDPSKKVQIAYVSGWTNSRQWDKYATQKSASISLVGGKKYYVEALLKEASGGDHLAVGWQLPTGALERPIPGNRVIQFQSSGNDLPVVTIASPEDGQSFTAPASVNISASASDQDGSITKVEFYNGTAKLGEDVTSPYAFAWNNVSAGNYTLTAKAIDNSGGSTSASVGISVADVAACAGTGTLQNEIWTGVTGLDVSSIPVDSPPSSVLDLTIFETPSGIGDDYGSRVRGYLCVPATGNYAFWISSDDRSELWLSTDDNPLNKRKIAYVSGWTNSRQWDKYATQKSASISLVGGKKYYVEALLKEASGGDHLAVGWQLPTGALERPIPGNRVIQFQSSGNDLPVVTIASPEDGQRFTAPASVNISAGASDPDGSITAVEFYNGTAKLGEDVTSPYAFAWNNVSVGSYTLTAKATDNSGGSASASVEISVSDPIACAETGKLQYETWTGVTGLTVSSIPVGTPPSFVTDLTIFETPANTGDNYGSRARGYLCVPSTGDYTFWIASDDHSELWLSTNEDPSNKVRIAYVSGWTYPRQWERYASQKSIPINLIGGRKYYVEALLKEATGGDHIAVGWQRPDGVFERPIPGNRLSPFLPDAAAATPSAPEGWRANTAETSTVELFPNPYKEGPLTMTIFDVDRHDPGSATTTATIQIISATGLVVYSQIIPCENGCATLLISVEETLPSGVYFVNGILHSRRYWKKLLVN